jgi:hypothetical protein
MPNEVCGDCEHYEELTCEDEVTACHCRYWDYHVHPNEAKCEGFETKEEIEDV